MCGFSGRSCRFLDHLGAVTTGPHVLDSDDLRNGIKAIRTGDIPTTTSRRVSSAGCDIVREMFQAGELQSLLTEKGLGAKATA